MKYAVSVVTIMLVLSFTSLGLAGKKYRWYIIKGKDGVCKVISANKKTSKMIAGPYKTRENALEAKAKKCKGKKPKKSKSKKKSSSKQENSLASEIGAAIGKATREMRKGGK